MVVVSNCMGKDSCSVKNNLHLAAKERALVGKCETKHQRGFGVTRSIVCVTVGRAQRAAQSPSAHLLGRQAAFWCSLCSLKSENPYYFTVNLLLFSEASIVFSEAVSVHFSSSPGIVLQRGTTGWCDGQCEARRGPPQPRPSPPRSPSSPSAAVSLLPAAFQSQVGGKGSSYCRRVLRETEEHGADEPRSK